MMPVCTNVCVYLFMFTHLHTCAYIHPQSENKNTPLHIAFQMGDDAVIEVITLSDDWLISMLLSFDWLIYILLSFDWLILAFL